VCTIWRHSRLEKITSQHTIAGLRAACALVRSGKLVFEPREISTHSLRSGAAMEMYFTGVPVYTIILIGRWMRDAFLHYIRRQVEQFLRNVSKQIIQFCYFWSIPDIAPRVVSSEDPRQCNHRDNVETRHNVGGNKP
jgi:hypothetical protein